MLRADQNPIVGRGIPYCISDTGEGPRLPPPLKGILLPGPHNMLGSIRNSRGTLDNERTPPGVSPYSSVDTSGRKTNSAHREFLGKWRSDNYDRAPRHDHTHESVVETHLLFLPRRGSQR